MELSIHNDIISRLQHFHKVGKIPNIIFHGTHASGKKYLLYNFIDLIYNSDKSIINKYVINVNCAQGKGIKFVREELKFFARTNMNNMEGNTFKTIILQNADKLTIDAQSALRRCIELFSHSTRFFIVVEDKFRLLKPIISRFCEIHVPIPIINGHEMNLYAFALNKQYKIEQDGKKRLQKLRKIIFDKPGANTIAVGANTSANDIMKLTSQLYNKGFSGLDIITLFESLSHEELNITFSRKYRLLILFQQIKKEFRDEQLCMLILLNYMLIRIEDTLENIGNM
jgi:DNA polymerase III delta prime subunit